MQVEHPCPVRWVFRPWPLGSGGGGSGGEDFLVMGERASAGGAAGGGAREYESPFLDHCQANNKTNKLYIYFF